MPISFSGSGPAHADAQKCDAIMRTLAQADVLRLRVLELQHFPFSDALREMFVAKGTLLEELLFRANGQINSGHVGFIGEKCPNLRKLTIKDVGVEEANSAYEQMMCRKLRLFTELTFVHISGLHWNPSVILPLVIGHACRVQQISMLNMGLWNPIDAAVQRLLQTNRLERLKTLSLYTGCMVTMPVIRQLMFGCPELTSFSFLQHEDMDQAEVDALRAEVVRKNLDIKLCPLEVTWNAHAIQL